MIHKQYYKNLDITLAGKPKGIEHVSDILPNGICYCILTKNGIVHRVDVYENAKHIHYKKFGYDDKGRVVENKMYSPNGEGRWRVVDDIWYYEYDQDTGLRSKKIMKMPGASKGREITYDKAGNKVSETENLL